MSDTPRVGAANTVITPPLGASIPGYFHDRRVTGVHDDLLARAVVIETDTPVAVLSLDLVAVMQETVEEIRRRAEAELGLAGERIMIHATHTHTGAPSATAFATSERNEYLDQLIPACVEALRQAQAAARPAELGVAATEVQGISWNRRYWMQDGTVRTNPGIGNPEVVRPAGPVDYTMTVFSFRPVEGGPLALAVNFALHLDTVGGTEVSADYPYYLTEALQEALGAETVVLFLNGACGDINHWDVLGGSAEVSVDDGLGFMRGGTDPGFTSRAGRRLAQATLDLLPEMEYQAGWSVDEAHECLRADLRQPSEEQLAEARALTEGKDRSGLTTIEEIYAWEALRTAELPEKAVDLEVQALRLGPAALVGIPNEVFAELGQLIKSASPFPHTAIVELANGWEGYLPTARAFAEGGYEMMLARSSKLVPETGEMVVAAAQALIKELLAREEAG